MNGPAASGIDGVLQLEYIDALQRVSAAMMAPLDFENCVSAIATAVSAATCWQFCWISAVDLANGFTEIVGRSEKVAFEGLTHRHWSLDAGPAHDALRSDGPLIIRDARVCDYKSYREDARGRGFISGMLVKVPELDLVGRPLVLYMQSPLEIPIATHDVLFLEAVAMLAGVAIRGLKSAQALEAAALAASEGVALTGATLDAVLSGVGPATIGARVSSALQMRLAVLDPEGQVVVDSEAGKGSPRHSNRADAGWSEAVLAARSDVAAGRVPRDGPHARVILFRLHAGNYCVLTAENGGTERVPERVRDLAMANAAVLLIVQAHLRLNDRLGGQSELLLRLLVSDARSVVALAPHLSELGFGNGTSLRLVLAARMTPNTADSDWLDRLTTALRAPGVFGNTSRVVTASTEDGLAVLVADGGDDDVCVTQLELLANEHEPALELLVGPVFRAISAIPEQWSGLCVAARATRGRSNRHVYDPRATKFLATMGRIAVDTEMTAQLRWQLDPLIDYDAKHNTELLATLEQYLSTGYRYIEAARDLHIHKNTMRYRLRRIEKVLGVSLSDPDVRFSLTVATWVVRASDDPINAPGLDR